MSEQQPSPDQVQTQQPSPSPEQTAITTSLTDNGLTPSLTKKTPDPSSKSTSNSYLFVFSALIVLLGPFNFGYNLSSFSANLTTIYSDFEITSSFTKHFLIPIFHIGGILNILTIGFFSDYFSRLFLIRSAATLSIFASFLCIFRTSIFALLSRLFAGFACATYLSIVPAYLNETCHYSKRGIYGALFQVFITVGIFFGTLFSSLKTRWVTYSLTGLNSLLILISSFCLLQYSPSYLLNNKNEREALRSFKRLRSNYTQKDIDDFLVDINVSEINRSSIKGLFSNSVNSIACGITLMLQLAQQFSAINVLLQFSTQLFESFGYHDSLELSLLLCGANILGAMISFFLVDVVGRKLLLVLSTFSICLFYVVFESTFWFGMGVDAAKWVQVVCLVLVIVFFNFGLGTIPWMIVSEMFESSFKGIAGSFNTFVNLVFTLVITFLGQKMIDGMDKGLLFVPFIGILGVCGVFFVFGIVETKKKDVEQVRNELKAKYRVKEDIYNSP